jgi:hypothetical protein
MLSITVVGTDRFLDLPTRDQALYLQLSMMGDDDGFISSPKKIAREARCTEKDLKLLEEQGYLIRFPSGVVCLTHWWVNNTLKNDRYTPTVYQEELHMLQKDESGMYCLTEAEPTTEPERNQTGTDLEPQQNITEQNIEECSASQMRIQALPTEALDPPANRNTKKQGRAKPSHTQFSPPTVEEVGAYCRSRGNQVDPQRFVDYYAACDWMRNKARIRDWKACVRTWEKQKKLVPSPTGAAVTLLTRDSYVPIEDTCPGWMEA